MSETCPDCGQTHPVVPPVEDVQTMSLAAHNSIELAKVEAVDAVKKGAPLRALSIRDRVIGYTEIAYIAASWAIELTLEKWWKIRRALYMMQLLFWGSSINLVVPAFSAICTVMLTLGFDSDTVERMAARGYRVNTLMLSKIAAASRKVVLTLLPKKEETGTVTDLPSS